MFKKNVILFTVLAALLISCGKKAKESTGDSAPGPRNPEDTRQEVVIKGQKLVCEDPLDCPDNIAKIVISGLKTVKNCTGVLIKEDEILTSASCLPKNLRIQNINCADSVFFVFPETDEKKSETFLCDKVIYADENIFEGFPELWKSDFAILKVKGNPAREASKIERNGVDPKSFKLWKVDIQTDKMGILSSTTCEVLRQTYLNPFSDDAFSGMFVTTGCALVDSNAGAPIFNDDQKILGIFSKEMSENIYTYLEISDVLNEEIGQYYHLSNTSCMLYDPESEQGEARISKECSKINTSVMRDKIRTSMLRNKKIHQENMNEIEMELEKPIRYFQWDVKFYAARNGRSFEAHFARPGCILNSKDWIDEFSKVRSRRRIIQTSATIDIVVPHYIFHTKLDRNLRPISALEQGGAKTYSITFNPYTAHVKKFTDVSISSLLDGRIDNADYANITTKCP